MNNLTNKLLTKVFDLAQTSGGISNVADKLIGRFLPSENAVAAICWTTLCGRCVNRVKRCRICCLRPPYVVCFYGFVRC